MRISPARGVAFSLLFTAAACTVGPLEGQDAPPVSLPSAPLSVRPAATEVRLEGLGREAPGVRQEVRALTAALLESGLAELPGVVPVVEGARVSPGLEDALALATARQRAMVELAEAAGGVVQLQVTLCPEGVGTCARHLATAQGLEALPQAVAGLLGKLALALGERAGPALEAQWAAPPSRDRYALYLAGRSAAQLYGWRAGPAEADVGDRKRDASVRALFIDPTNPLAWWLSGRQQLVRGVPEGAQRALRRAVELRGRTRLFRADEAAALASGGAPAEVALEAWEGVRQRAAPEDLRFALPHARALLGADQAEGAARTLDLLPASLHETAPVLRLRAALADAGQPVGDLDALLARWAESAPGDAEPVRRRIQLRVRGREYAEALPLTLELERRGERREARELSLALAVALGSWELAASRALELELPELAARIEARAALEDAPAEVPLALSGTREPLALVARGGAALRAGAPRAALEDAEQALRALPHLPEGLALRASALRALGRDAEAAQAEAALRRADPAYPPLEALAAPAAGSARAPGTRT
jgi:predicted Zn-dependent protease